MRLLTPVCAALVTLATCFAPTATAEPTTLAPPEMPPRPGVPFVDNPAIVDPHPMPVESWTRVGAGDVLALHFTTGTPQCYGVTATAHETPDTVTVELRGGIVPEAVGRACIEIAVFGTLEVPLQHPVGARRVLSVY
ncbi:hypothetical protein ABQE93_03120 [Mycolicibacterium sp. XJ662]